MPVFIIQNASELYYGRIRFSTLFWIKYGISEHLIKTNRPQLVLLADYFNKIMDTGEISRIKRILYKCFKTSVHLSGSARLLVVATTLMK